jgi:hypothetical protein
MVSPYIESKLWGSRVLLGAKLVNVYLATCNHPASPARPLDFFGAPTPPFQFFPPTQHSGTTLSCEVRGILNVAFRVGCLI